MEKNASWLKKAHQKKQKWQIRLTENPLTQDLLQVNANLTIIFSVNKGKLYHINISIEFDQYQ